MKHDFDLAVIGHLTVDDIVLPNGQTRMGSPGGDALYAFLGAKFWEVEPLVITCQSKDHPPETLHTIQALGIKQELLPSIGAPPVRQWALYDVNGGRTYVAINKNTSYYDISPRVDMYPGSVLARLKAVHIAPMPLSLQQEWVNRLYELGVSYISLDPHEDCMHDLEIWSALLPKLTVFMPSKVEVDAMLGPGVDDLTAVREIAEMGPKIVVYKQGENGCLVYEKNSKRMVRISAYSRSEVDPTGCGDSFCGGFMAGYYTTGDAIEAACWGSVSSSFILEDYGPAAGMCMDSKAVKARLESYRDILNLCSEQERLHGT